METLLITFTVVAIIVGGSWAFRSGRGFAGDSRDGTPANDADVRRRMKLVRGGVV